MSESKPKYEQLVEDVVEVLKHSPEEFNHVLEQSGRYANAASDLTKDELALISAYVKYDLKTFASEYEESKSSPFYLALVDSIWQGLLDITDKTQVEWVELFEDLEHKGLYQAGEMIGLGILVCEKCGHKTTYNHPTVISPCYQCGNKAFSRVPLRP